MAPRWLLVGLLAAARAASPDAAEVTVPQVAEVHTKLGSLRGEDYGDVLVFKGVPYAEKPGRFMPPEPKQPWEGTRDATRFGDACIHGGARIDLDPRESYGASEDCLHANIWVPKVWPPPQKPLPVIVFIHGGAFIVMTGSYPAFWGDAVVSDPELPVVYVSFNYRLGIFGFYSSEDAGSNFGFQDQQMLLRWVRDNIAAFGGDPNQVTLSGQSAGAMSVVCHLAAPGSAGLFHRAMAISPVGLHYRDHGENSKFVNTVAIAAGCERANNVTECLRRRSTLELEAADIVPEYMFHFFGPCKECDNFLPWLPVVGDDVLPLSPLQAIRQGVHNKVPTMISSTSNETLGFLPTLAEEIGDRRFIYELIVDAFMKDRAGAVKRHYAEAPDTAHEKDPMQLAGIVTTDAMMTCYSRYMAKLLAHHAPAYLSTFAHAPKSCDMAVDKICTMGQHGGAACHACDLPYALMRSPRSIMRTGVGYWEPGEKELAKKYTTDTLKFAYGDLPNMWEYHGSHDVSNMWDIDGVHKVAGFHRDHCDFWEEIGFPFDPWVSRSPVAVAAAANATSPTPILV